MQITNLSLQVRNKNRVNVSVDGKYKFSLEVGQVAELGVRRGKEYTEEELVALEAESQFGKVYVRALEYCLSRPHSVKEVQDYLYRKTRDSRTKTGGVKKGISPSIVTRVFNRLVERGYVDDERFTRYWVENRNMTKGMSRRKLVAELRIKDVDQAIIDAALAESPRSDMGELQKIIAKKRPRYPDPQKLMQYLTRQGFGYEDIKTALSREE